MFASVSYYYKKNFVDFCMERLHSHNPHNFEIMYVKEGSCTITTDKEEHSLSAGSFILLGNGCPHKLEAQSASIFNIEFDLGVGDINIDAVINEYPLLREVFSKQALPLWDRSETFRALDELISELRENGEGLCGALLFSRLLIEIARSYERRSVGKAAYVQAACDYIGEHFCEPLSVTEIAAEIGINRAYLQSLFRRVTGKTVLEYINSLRIAKACFIMKNTDLAVVDIAVDCGFASRQHFMYTFKKYTGMTAKQYRGGTKDYERE